ncbi:uncharacterized protein LOC131065702 [Cryptomeria japonica]|uniref:uncharacterized protein LOC131065702 n=1 Tax=Cryptomeria japonica TaxID=3369 RepID=UPI0025ACA458|nr:uncharacterized protein LOC131065702 [Cryptomeria japonica]
MPMGYEVDETTLDAYAQHLLNALVDTKEERLGTCQEKSMELHTKFTEPARKIKVTKIVEEILVEEGHPREKVRVARATRDAIEKEKEQKTTPTPVKVKVTGSSPTPVKTPPIEAKSFDSSAKGKGVQRKKQKPQREYVAVSPIQFKTESDADIPKAPKKGEFARVIQKPQSSAERKEKKEKKSRSNLVPTSKPKQGKKKKSDLDEAIESKEDTQDVAEQQVLDSVEVEPIEVNDKSSGEEVGAPSGDTTAQEAPKEDKSG